VDFEKDSTENKENYSYNKTNEMHQFLQIYFWNRTLHVSERLSVHTAISVCIAVCTVLDSWR